MSESSSPEDRRQEEIIPPDGAEDREFVVRLYNVAPEEMPPSPAGGGAEAGGEAAASRRPAGLPPELEARPEHQSGVPTPGAEPILGYDGMATDDLVEWIYDADPDPATLRAIYEYERENERREAVLDEVEDRLRRIGSQLPCEEPRREH
ncbi:MAG TPA: hypothetical protein VFQ38_10120 [Longimicrobiales bacterium]|nr:hypothetical protein [Longimicrobiales bacterium]